MDELRRDGFDRCFIALHGRFGEDGTVQGALELLGIPYTGPGVMASAVAMDKLMTKRIWLAEGLPTPAWRQVRSADETRAAFEALGSPMIVKPVREGSTIGLTKVLTADQCEAAYALAAGQDPMVMCEQFIAGDEVTCPVLGTGSRRRALPVIRIVAPDGNYDYQNKYFTDDTQYLVPCGLPAGRRSRHPGPGAQGVPHAGLPGLGARRRDDRRPHAPPLAAGDQHLAWHDRPFAGADVGPRHRSVLRGPVPERAGHGRLDNPAGGRRP
jgi:hypothetical protein